MPVFKICEEDTSAPADVDGDFAEALVEGAGEAEALRFGAAVASLKCTRIGGAAAMPVRADVAALLAKG